MSAQDAIPIFNSLSDIYPSTSAVLRESKRWDTTVSTFTERYGAPPSHVIRAPGRLNVLGEHIDYSLFSVLPAAIEQDIIIAILPRASSSSTTPIINVSNLDTRFPSSSFQLRKPSENSNAWNLGFVSPKNGGGWENYLKAAMMECLERFYSEGRGCAELPRSVDMLVSGTIPPGSGLSSSAAFVVAGVLTFLVANGRMKGITKGDVIELAIASEHRMGVRTGGMDQSASVLGQANSLLHLSFYPDLHPVPLPLPPSIAIVITNSLTPHALASSAPVQYNLRVVEMLCATRLLLHAWGLDQLPEVRLKRGSESRMVLRQVLELWADRKGGEDGACEEKEQKLLEGALNEIEGILGADGRKERGWTKEEMIEASGLSAEHFKSDYLDFLEIRATHFHLYQRVYHTLDESLRVLKFRKLCHEIANSTAASSSTVIRNERLSRDVHATTNSTGHEGHFLNGRHNDAHYVQGHIAHLNGTKHINGDPKLNGHCHHGHASHSCAMSKGDHYIHPPETDPRFLELGRLITDSHQSCQEVYDCTHPFVDECKDVCLRAGSLGSRMTGGGWGGAIISLVPVDRTEEFLRSVKKGYRLYKGLTDEELEAAAFATLPGSGAGVYVIPT